VRIGAIAVAVVLACRYLKCSVAACWRCVDPDTSLRVQSAAGSLKPLRKAPSRCCCVIPDLYDDRLVVVHRKGLSDFYEHVLGWLGAVGTLLFVPFGVALVLQFGFVIACHRDDNGLCIRSPVLTMSGVNGMIVPVLLRFLSLDGFEGRLFVRSLRPLSLLDDFARARRTCCAD